MRSDSTIVAGDKTADAATTLIACTAACDADATCYGYEFGGTTCKKWANLAKVPAGNAAAGTNCYVKNGAWKDKAYTKAKENMKCKNN